MANQFPKHDINPALKNEEWHRQFAQAAWDEYKESGIKIGYNARDEYKEIDDYVLGKQSMSKHKKAAAVDEASDSSWVNADFRARSVTAKLRDIGISKITQRMFNITATPIDLLAKDETEQYYAKHKARIQMREAIMRENPELANSPAFAKAYGEPEDMEELEMMMNLGIKLKVAMEAEMGIDYVFYHNKFKHQRRENIEQWWDYGLAGYKEYVDENGEVRHRSVSAKNFISSFCYKKDFSDARYIGEVTNETVGALPFDRETRRKIAEKISNQSWNQYDQKENPGWDKEKAQVLDIEFMSENDRIFERREKDGNLVNRRTSWDKKSKQTKTVISGEEVMKYVNKPVQMIYKCKWVIGTDYVYDFGPATYQKREAPNKALTTYSYHMYAPGMQGMRITSMQSRLLPIIDEYHTTVFKIQNFKNKWVPYIINLDLAAMENVAMGSGGGNMAPKEILELVMNNFTALGRRMDAVTGQNQNYKMVDVEPTGMGQEYTTLVNDLGRILNEMRDVTGLNDLTDGSTPGERTLNYVASLGAEATNNALYPLTWADKSTTESLAKGVILRLVQTIQKKEIDGVARTLGDETVKFIRVTKDIAKRVWDIKLEDRPTDADRQMLMQQINVKESQGLIGPDDVIMISQTSNLKQAQVILAHKINKRRKEMEESKQRDVMANGQVQQQSTIINGEQERATLQLEYDLKLRNELAIWEKKKEIEIIKVESNEANAETQVGGKLLQQQMQHEESEMTE